MTPLSALSFGVDSTIRFSLTGESVDPGATYWWEATSGGIDFGNPEQIVTEIQSQLLDGSIGKVTSMGNRVVELKLRLWSSTENVADLEDGEKALRAEINRAGWNQLAWTPALTGSQTTVYDVVQTPDLQFTLDEGSERNCIRNYTLTLTCLPFPRSADQVTVSSLPAQSVTPATTLVNDGSSAANWSTGVQREVRRNLMPCPSFENGAPGWNVGAGTDSISVTSRDSYPGYGANVLNIHAPYATASRRSYVNAPQVPATAGSTYAIQGVVYSAGAPIGLLVRAINAAGTVISETDYPGASSAIVTMPAGTATLAVYFYITVPANNAWGWTLDGVIIEKASSYGTYFDGNTAGAAWIGTPGNSASVTLTAATVTSTSGMVSAGKTYGAFAYLILTQSINASTQTYLAVAGNVAFAEGGVASSVAFVLSAGGAMITPSSVQYDSTSGSFTAYFRVAATVTSAILTASGAGLTGGFATLKIDNTFTSDSLPVIGTPRQQARQIPVYGSARTQASLRIATTDAALGQTLVFCSPPPASGMQPALRTYRTAGPSTTADATMASGSKNTLALSQAAADTWSISTALLAPDTYEFYARLIVASTTTVTLNWRATGSANSQVPVVTGSRQVTIPAGGAFVSIAALDLPTARAYAGSTDTVTLQLWVTLGSVTIDDAYLFGSVGQLDIFDVTSCSLLLLNSASIAEPQPTAWVGKAIGSSGGSSTADTSVVFAGNRAASWEQMQFTPPTVNVFVVAIGTLLMQVSANYPPRWGHHAGKVAA